jgi:uncharacterized membrane protein YoaK (UPF0700 family)
VFTANMTGNVVLLGFGLAGAGGLPVLAPVISLLAFVAGAGPAGNWPDAWPIVASACSRSPSPRRPR